jgi:preprotein translocase subunit YajC
LGSLIVIIALFALLWLLLIRPQRARAQQQQRLLESVDVGDEILSSGGIIGVVRGVDDEANELHVEIAPGVEVRMDRRAVGSIVTKDEAEVAEEDEVEEADELEDDEASVNSQAEDRGAEAAEPDRRYPGTPA